MSWHMLAIFGLLAGLSIAYSTAARRIELLRRALARGHVSNTLDVWMLSGALLLSPWLAAGLVIVAYAAEWPARRIVGSGRPFRYVYSVASVAAAAVTADIVHQQMDGPAGVAVAIVVWTVTNYGLIMAAMSIRDRSALRMFRDPNLLVVDLSTKILGVALTVALAWHVASGALVVPALIALHVWSLRYIVHTTRAIDAGTGLWSEDGWRAAARAALASALGCVLLMVIDPEDASHESAVAGVLATLRPAGVCGRYASRQVVALVPVDLAAAGSLVARRIRSALTDAGIASTVGAVTSHGECLDDMLLRAGADLMARRARAGIVTRW